MVAKLGRPASKHPKDFMLRVRLDAQTLEKLDACCKARNTDRSKIVREGIEAQYDKLKK